MTNKYAAILISFILVNYAATAQNWTLKVSSNVELKTWKLGNRAEKEEKALGGASIKLLNGSSVVNEITSKPNGDFSIDVPANGEYMLEVSYPGCNTKRFAISTNNASGTDNSRQSVGIEGFIMARPLPGIDYSGLKNPLLKISFHENNQKFDMDDEATNRGLKTVSKIAEAENALVEKFAELNKTGDAALSKNDCPTAKSNYEKAIALIPGEPYPANQLVKVGDCFKQKDAEKQKEGDKKDADKKAVEEAVAKAAADKAARERAESDKLMLATAQAAQKKEKEEKAAEKAPPAATAKAPTINSTPTPTTNNSVIKIKPKSEAELKKEAKQAKQREGLAKSNAEDREAMQKDYEKAEENRLKQRREEAERAQKERDGLAADKAKTESEDKAEAAKLEEKRQKEKAGQAAAEAKIIEEDKAEAAKREERRLKEKEALAAEQAKIIEEDKAEAAKLAEKRQKEKEGKAAAEAKTIEEDKADAAKKTEARLKREAEEEKRRKEELAEQRKESENMKLEEGDYKTPQPIGVNKYKEVITRADDYYKTKRYGEAKKLYEEALILKANDAHATQRIAEINKMTQTK